MDDPLSDAALCHERAEHMRALALDEDDGKRRRVLLAIAEQYYLLHDRLVELERLPLMARVIALWPDRPAK